jgi:nitrite reductase/ring-hydroxylating ferredoxin subunit
MKPHSPTPNAPRAARLHLFGRPLPAAESLDVRPDFQQAEPAFIKRALGHSQNLPSGGWYVLDAVRNFGIQPRRMQLLGRQLVVWRSGMQLLAAPDVCPHMGAALSEGRVCDEQLVCPWHGLAFGPQGKSQGPDLRLLPTFDDGYLLWVQVANQAERSEKPYLPTRPSRGLDAVIRVEAACEPVDVLANRLDPWHGVHFHPHSFGTLRLLERSDEAITVRVAYRLFARFAVEVDARFHCPDPRSIVMTIVRGEGEGSVVETHATPLAPGQTAVVELTLASSDRFGFALAKRIDWLLRPAMQWAARRLWREDASYAERLHSLRAHVKPAQPRRASSRATPQPTAASPSGPAGAGR